MPTHRRRCGNLASEGRGRGRLAWLGVDASVRRRGIGRLLLETSIARAEIAGAGIIAAHVPPQAADMQGLLGSAGFVMGKGGEFRLLVGVS